MSGQVRNMNEERFLQSDMLLPTLIRFTMKRCKYNTFQDFPLFKEKLKIGQDVKNIDKNLIKWIIDYTNNKLIMD